MAPVILVMFDVWDNAINNFPHNFLGQYYKTFFSVRKGTKLECLSLVFVLFQACLVVFIKALA